MARVSRPPYPPKASSPERVFCRRTSVTSPALWAMARSWAVAAGLGAAALPAVPWLPPVVATAATLTTGPKGAGGDTTATEAVVELLLPLVSVDDVVATA